MLDGKESLALETHSTPHPTAIQHEWPLQLQSCGEVLVAVKWNAVQCGSQVVKEVKYARKCQSIDGFHGISFLKRHYPRYPWLATWTPPAKRGKIKKSEKSTTVLLCMVCMGLFLLRIQIVLVIILCQIIYHNYL